MKIVILFFALFPFIVKAQVVELIRQLESNPVEEKLQVPHMPITPVPVDLPAGDSATGDTIAVTTYDYFTNNIMRKQIVQFNGTVYFANMIRGFDPGNPTLRNIRFIYQDAGIWKQEAPFGEGNQTGWPSIDLDYNGMLLGIPVITGHTPCRLALWDAGSASFIVSSPFSDGEFPSVLFLKDKIFLTNGCTDCTPYSSGQYWFYESTDLGASITNWGLFSDFSPPINFVETSSSELGMAKSPDGTKAVIFGTVDMLSGDGGVAVWDGVPPEDADRIFTIESTDGGVSWTGENYTADGDFSEMAPGFHISNFAPLPENFGQIDMLIDDTGNKHTVINGYGGQFNASLDTLIDFAYPLLYRNDNTGGWIGISNPVLDTLSAAIVNELHSAFSVGQCYPSLAMSEDGMNLYCVWQGPQLNPASPIGVDTAGGFLLYDLYHAYSTDGGMTWNSLGVLQGDASVSEMYPNVAARLEKLDGSRILRAHIVYLTDPTNGCSVHFESDADNAYIVYRTFDFLSQSNASITLRSPDGETHWRTKSTQNIEWTSINVDSVSIAYSTNAGAYWQIITEAYPASEGSFSWHIPDNPSVNGKMWITSSDDYSVFDMNSGFFTLYQPEVFLLHPNGGEHWQVGTEQTIKWNVPHNEPVKVEYSWDNGNSWTVIEDSTYSDSLRWVLPYIMSELFRIKVTSLNDPEYYDISDTTFSIYVKGVSVTYPDGGEVFIAHHEEEITWTSNQIDEVVLEYSTDEGSSWIIIDTTEAADFSYLWSVPSVESELCRIKIYDVSNSSRFDISDSNYVIHKPGIQVLSPNGGEEWESGYKKKITWQSENVYAVQIYYSKNGGDSWNIVGLPQLASTGEYEWTVPSSASENCLVKLTDSRYPAVYDQSDSLFTIFTTVNIDLSNDGGIPAAYYLYQNYPNPFNPASTIYFDLPEPADVKLTIYNVQGSEIASPVDGYFPAGRHHIVFHASDLPSGVYFYKLRAGNFVAARKMLLLR